MALTVLNIEASLISERMAKLRDRHQQAFRLMFRQWLRDVGFLMGHEISKSLSTWRKKDIETPLGTAREWTLTEHPTIVGILRAAMPMVEGLMDAFPESDVGWIGAFRHYADGHHHFEIEAPYWAVPPLAGKTVLLVDPMIATGRSIIRVLHRLKKETPARIVVVGLVAARPGVEAVQRDFPEVDVVLAALDEALNKDAYIVPGLGDAGDLAFGPKI